MWQLLKRAMPLAFGFGLVLTTVLLLIPAYTVPKAFNFYDKAQHSLVFLTLSLAGLLAFPSRLRVICWGLCVYGGAMEVMQSTLTATRHGDVVDWAADCAGVVVGLGLYWIGAKFNKFAINKIAA